VRAGSLVIVEPGQAMAYGRRDRAWANSYIRVSGSLVAALWKAHGFRHGQVHPLADAASFLRHLESIRLEMDRPGETQALVLEGLFGALCGEVLRPLSPPLALEAPQDSALERIHKKIQASFREKLEMRALASESGMAEVDFCRAFRKAYGMPPRRYAIELRLRHAAELLARAETAVRHVATACGYDDPFHFSKAFKHRFGVSPTLFRARADGAGEGAIRIRPGDLL
jgi:AraC-like DNA-binding protein